MDNNKYLVLNPSYGYLTHEQEYKGFDIQRAGLFTKDVLDSYGIDYESNEFVLTPISNEQIDNLPFDLFEAESLDKVITDGLSDIGNTIELS